MRYEQLLQLLRGRRPSDLLPPAPSGYLWARVGALAQGTCMPAFNWNGGFEPRSYLHCAHGCVPDAVVWGQSWTLFAAACGQVRTQLVRHAAACPHVVATMAACCMRRVISYAVAEACKATYLP